MLVKIMITAEASCILCVQVSAPGSLSYAGEVLARCQALASAAQGGSVLLDHASFKVTKLCS